DLVERLKRSSALITRLAHKLGLAKSAFRSRIMEDRFRGLGMVRFRPLVLFSLAPLIILTPSAANAQVLYGSIVGNVKDTSEAAVAGATVAITNSLTGVSREAATNEAGGYSFPNVQTGSYDLKVTKEGFTTFAQPQVVVTINTITRVDATLKVGAVTETVTVAAETAALQPDRSEDRTETSTHHIQHLHLPL